MDGPRVSPIFYDPSQKRWPHIRRGVFVMVAAVTSLTATLVVSILINPALPALHLPSLRVLPNSRHVAPPRAKLLLTAPQRALDQAKKRLQAELWRQAIARRALPAHAAADGDRPQVIGFYVNWDDASMSSLQQNIGRLDVLVPQWLQLAGADGSITLDDPAQQDRVIALVRKERPDLQITPLVSNWNGRGWDGATVGSVLAAPTARRRLADALLDYVRGRGLAGVSVDFEEVPEHSRGLLVTFVSELAATLHAAGLRVSVNVPADDAAFDYARLAQAADALIVMAYDEHWATGPPGPISSLGWFTRVVSQRARQIPREKRVIALGSYAYDWPRHGPATEKTFEEAVLTAKDSEASIRLDPSTLNATFDYEESDGSKHVVWLLDAPAIFDQLAVLANDPPQGVALWRLGSEDPSIWTFFGKSGPFDATTASACSTVRFGYGLDYEGEGEILEVSSVPRVGSRTIAFDDRSGLITAEHFTEYPSPYVLSRYGRAAKKIALTFDDGPDAEYTPAILDILRDHGVPATFFVIGANGEEHPELLRREIAEGHEIGSHTFTHPNIASISTTQFRLELSATKRLLESEIGRDTHLFRPPYAIDAEPETADQVRPLEMLSDLGYLTVGMQIDPGDWQRPGSDAIVSATLAAADRGNVVLLHDSGGDRSQTVEALPRLIAGLRERGFEFVAISGLLGMSRDQLVPPLEGSARATVWADRAAFGVINAAIRAIHGLFLAGIVLGIGRLLFIGTLAAIERWRSHRTSYEPNYDPSVAVIVPAFNEEKMIEKTVVSLLACEHPSAFEIVVVDDGSTDGTYALARQRFAGEPRVRVLTKTNDGKPAALNFGLAHTKAEIIVALDADTVFAKDTIRKLVGHFADPGIGAVAGNTKVGNRINLMTLWQALEYITSQNLDRRAFHVLDCITVVPGAVGAWRRAAVERAAGFTSETLAEDADLTLAVRRLGYSVVYDDEAVALTEAPDTVRGFLRQRYRWTFGTLQAAWKHADTLFRPRYGSLGFVALPNIFVFQILFPMISPVVDLLMVTTLLSAGFERWQHPAEPVSDNLWRVLFYYALFVAIDFAASALAFILEKGEDRSLLLWLFWQRFFYRQLMYYVAIRSVVASLRGLAVGWGVVERKATVNAA
jgi:peptidoglycan-N-acetylglucosamine deacetylase